MSRCLSRTAWRVQCRTTRPRGALPCPATRASRPPAAPAVVRKPHTCPIPTCRPPACAACKSSARSTSRAVSSPPSPPGGQLPSILPEGFGHSLGFPCGSADKKSACNAGDLGWIPGLGRYPREGKGYPLQYSGLENSMGCIIRGVAKSRTWLSDFHFHRVMPGVFSPPSPISNARASPTFLLILTS